MTVLGDKIKRWCQEESLSVVAEQDDEAGLACTVSLPGESPLSISVRASGPQPSRILLVCAFDLSVPAKTVADPEGPQQIATLLERVAANRSGLVECHPPAREGKTPAEVVVTLHEDGLSKHSFLTALEEVSKVTRVIAWELEGISMSAEVLSDVRAIVEQAGTFASEVAQVGGKADAPASAPAATVTPAPVSPPAPAPPPAAAPPAAVFCPNCGRQAKPQQRFCSGCGTSLEG